MRQAFRNPDLGTAVLLAGSLLAFYLVGLLMIPLGLWLTRRAA